MGVCATRFPSGGHAQLGPRVCVELRDGRQDCAPALAGIIAVLLMSADQKMRWIAAGAVVAGVANYQAAACSPLGEPSVGYQERDPMSLLDALRSILRVLAKPVAVWG